MTFEEEKLAAGLKGDWDHEDGDDTYSLSTAWWQSFNVMGEADHWTVYQADHDAGVGDDGQSTTAWDTWDEVFASWTDAAKEIESRYLRRKD